MNTASRKQLEDIVKEANDTLGNNHVVKILEYFIKKRREYEIINIPPNPYDTNNKILYDNQRDNYALIQTKKHIKTLIPQ